MQNQQAAKPAAPSRQPFGAAGLAKMAAAAQMEQGRGVPSLLGACTSCLAARKGAELEGAPAELLPPVQSAICLVGGTGCCYGCLQVARQSPLLVPTPGQQR